jgi:hypothetical protein
VYRVKQEEKKNIKNLKGQEYAGTESCRNCHQAIYDFFSATRHHHESEPASEENIKGSFSKNENIIYLDSTAEVDNGKKGRRSIPGGLYKREEERAERFDITIGTGKHGQTYLYWNIIMSFTQLPCLIPPIRIIGVIVRAILTTKYFLIDLSKPVAWNAILLLQNRIYFLGFDRNQMIYGIDCERCHGPAANHVEFHTAHTGREAREIYY